MIVVIADDFSGAAEIGGIGLRYGLSSEIHTQYLPEYSPDLLIIDTNTRASSGSDAARAVRNIAPDLLKRSEWIYKKTDSVFRGHIAVELETLMEVTGVPTALLVPANPSMGRILSNGIYTIQGVPLQKTEFSDDPESSYHSSQVVGLLNAPPGMEVHNFEASEKVIEPGITIGNAEKQQDLRLWASQVNDRIIPAGGADFFASILETRGMKTIKSATDDEFHFGDRVLIIQGAQSDPGKISAIGENKAEAANQLIYGFTGPGQLDTNLLREWSDNTVHSLLNNRITIVGFRSKCNRTRELSQTLVGFTADLIHRILEKVYVDHLLVEGGTTASVIVRRMTWTRWIPVHVIQPGTVSLKEATSGLTLTVKPGSYQWPGEITPKLNSRLS